MLCLAYIFIPLLSCRIYSRTEKADAYSFGIVLAESLIGKLHSSYLNIKEIIQDSDDPDYPFPWDERIVRDTTQSEAILVVLRLLIGRMRNRPLLDDVSVAVLFGKTFTLCVLVIDSFAITISIVCVFIFY